MILLTVKVKPRAKGKNVGVITYCALTKTYTISVKEPPIDNEANDAVISLLSKVLKLPRASIEIVQGKTSKNKVIRIADINAEEVESIIKEFADNQKKNRKQEW